MNNVPSNGTLELGSGACLIIAVILGSGILVLPGVVFSNIGRDGIYAWICCAILSLPVLITMVILGSRHPSAGGVAFYARLAFGQYLELFVSFLFLGATALGLPAIAIVGATYLQRISSLAADVDLFAALLVLCAAYFACSGGQALRNSVRLVGGGSLVLLVGTLFVLLALVMQTKALQFTPPKTFTPIISQIPIIFFAFTGWDIACHLSVDFRNPKRDFGPAMLLAFTLVCGVYIASATLVDTANITSNFDAPIYGVAIQVLPFSAAWLVSLLGVSLIVANLFGSVVAVSRLGNISLR